MNIIYAPELWVIAIALLLALLVAAEVSYRFGQRASPHVDAGGRTQFSAVEAAVLGLLGLFLAFSFSAAGDRFDVRRKLVVKEANGIGTAYLRTELLPESVRGEAQDLWRRYVDARLEFYYARADLPRVEAAVAEAGTLQGALWAIAVAEGRKAPHDINALILQSLNDVIDISAERIAADRAHVPALILWLLMLVACAGLGTVGYAFGLVGLRRHLATLLLVVLVTSIVATIMDLDRPRRGIVLINQQSMRDLKASMVRPPAPPRVLNERPSGL
jgi:hypothetical protein